MRDLKHLQARKFIDYQELSNESVRITLTKRGREKILEYNIDNIQLSKDTPWDGIWRMVMFDIPHHKKAARDILRPKLETLGFHPIQKSVFITPYPCEDEIDFICSFYEVRSYVLIFEVSRFEGEEKLKHYFHVWIYMNVSMSVRDEEAVFVYKTSIQLSRHGEITG